MIEFFKGLIDQEIVEDSNEIFSKLERSKLRSLKSNLRQNEVIRMAVNSKQLTIKDLIDLPQEDLACEDMKKRREETKKKNLRDVIRPICMLSKDEINILVNRVEDP